MTLEGSTSTSSDVSSDQEEAGPLLPADQLKHLARGDSEHQLNNGNALSQDLRSGGSVTGASGDRPVPGGLAGGLGPSDHPAADHGVPPSALGLHLSHSCNGFQRPDGPGAMSQESQVSRKGLTARRLPSALTVECQSCVRELDIHPGSNMHSISDHFRVIVLGFCIRAGHINYCGDVDLADAPAA